MGINEAFAAQSVAVIRELAITEEKVNVNGGQLPWVTQSGRAVPDPGHAFVEMKRTATRFGIAGMCIGTVDIAMLVEIGKSENLPQESIYD